MQAAKVDPVAEERAKDRKAAETVTFRSSDVNLRLVKDKKKNVMSSAGELTVSEGHTVEFEPTGVVNVPSSDKDTLKFLRKHPQRNVLYVEVGDEPDRPAQGVDNATQVVEAAVDGDVERLTAIYMAERNGQSRPEVLKAAAKAIEKLNGDEPPPEPVPAHQLQRYRDPSVQTNPEAPPADTADPEADGSTVAPEDAQPPAVEPDQSGEELTGDALDARAQELEIEGRSAMSADEKRKAIAKAEQG